MEIFKENCMLEKQQLVKEGNRVKVQGIFQRADTPNKNGRVYTRGLWESILKRNEVKDMLEGRNMLGELDHPDVTETSLKNVSHIVTKLELNTSNEIIGEAEILDTPNGIILQKLIEAGVKVGISSRGYVTDDSKAKQTSEGHYKVPESFILKTFDFVVDPSTPGAFPSSVNESVKAEIISLVESSGDTVSAHIRSVCESLNTDSEKGAQQMDADTKIQLESKIESQKQTINALESSYRTIYIEKTNLEVKLENAQGISEGSDLKVVSKLETAVELIEELRDLVLEKDGKLEEATEIVEGLAERLTDTESLLEEVTTVAQERLSLSVEVVENLRDRYLAAEDMVKDLEEEKTYVEGQLEASKNKVTKLEGAQKMETFVLEKSKALGMNESAVRDAVKECGTIEEATDALLSVKSRMERHYNSLPVAGRLDENKKDNLGTTAKKPLSSNLARAISGVR